MKTLIIAEMSANHNHDKELGIDIIHAAKESGADAIKLQTYTPDTLTIKSDKKDFLIKGGLWNGNTLYELYESAYTPWDWHIDFKIVADSIGIELFSTPFDLSAIDFLEELGVSKYKIASFENRDAQILRGIANTGKPAIMSTGMSTLNDIENSINFFKQHSNAELSILKCTSSYPATIKESNVALIPDMKKRFNLEVGVSDHTPGWYVPVASVALGGTIIEKHLTISRKIKTPDSAFSMEPSEFSEMVQHVREMEKTASSSKYGTTKGEEGSIFFRRSLYITSDVKRGDTISSENIRSIRPGMGMNPLYYYDVVSGNYSFNADYERGVPLTGDMINEDNDFD